MFNWFDSVNWVILDKNHMQELYKLSRVINIHKLAKNLKKER